MCGICKNESRNSLCYKCKKKIQKEFPLTPEIKNGLMGRGGVYSDVFDLAYSYEKADWAAVDIYVSK